MAQANAGGPSGGLMIRPDSIDKLPVQQEEKNKWKHGLTQLWTQLESLPPGSPQYADIENKIKGASMKVMQSVRAHQQGGQANRPASGGAAAPRQNPQQGDMAPAMQQQGSQQGQQGQQYQQQQQGANMSQQQASQIGLAQQLGEQGATELRNLTIHIPAQILDQGNESHVQNYKSQFYKKASTFLQRREQARRTGQELSARLNQGQGSPQQIQQWQQQVAKCKTEMNAMNAEWQKMRTQNNNHAPGQSQGMQRQQSQPGQQPGDVKMTAEQATSQSPQQQQNNFTQLPQQGQVQGQVAHSPTLPPQNMAQPSQAQGQAPRQTPQTATQPQPPQNFPQQGNMQQQQPQPNQQRPPMNAQQQQQMAQAQAQAQQRMAQVQQSQQQGAPGSGVPQSATQQQPPQQPQRPPQAQPLSHADAVQQAQAAYHRDQAQAAQQPQQPQLQNIPNGNMQFNQHAPHSATSTTPTSAHAPLATSNQFSSSNNQAKNVRPLQHQGYSHMPVAPPASRPTLATSGMMSQPGIPRPAQFTLEGEGDRVLSKRKLDELVRQVTGSTAEENALSPEMEEAVLNLADDFVDSVITSACRLAKLRSSQTLDIRDVQIALERNYGIRIPGYSLDEARSVRKFQPAPGWQSKMQAVQAGKVMGGVSKDS